MKTTIKHLLMAAAAMLMTLPLSSQGRSNRISREELAVKQAEHISEELAFDEATSEKFKQTYCDFQKEVWALGPKPGGRQSETPDEAEMIQQRFDRSQKILDLRKKYYDIYSTFLSQKQISRVYEIERDMMRRLSRQGADGTRQQTSKSKRNAYR